MSQAVQEAIAQANAAQPNGQGTQTQANATQGTETGTAGTTATGTSTGTEDGRGSKDAVLADLATERDRRQAAETAAQAAQQQTQAVLKAVQEALGLKTETDDPKALQEQLQAAQSETMGAKLQLAIYRSGAAKGADVDALLDSNAFQTAIKGVNPSDANAVTAAIQQFITQNPRFQATTDGAKPVVPPASKDLGQGNTQTTPGKTMDDLIRG